MVWSRQTTDTPALSLSKWFRRKLGFQSPITSIYLLYNLIYILFIFWSYLQFVRLMSSIFCQPQFWDQPQVLPLQHDSFCRHHGRYPTFWVDKFCIDQRALADGLRVLPVNVPWASASGVVFQIGTHFDTRKLLHFGGPQVSQPWYFDHDPDCVSKFLGCCTHALYFHVCRKHAQCHPSLSGDVVPKGAVSLRKDISPTSVASWHAPQWAEAGHKEIQDIPGSDK